MTSSSWKTISSENVANPTGAFSHGSIVPVSDTVTYVHTSGLTSRDANGEVVGVGDVTRQTTQVMEKLREVLQSAGCELSDVFKVLVFIRNMEDFDAIHAVRKKYFTPPYPASTMVQVSRMVDDRSLIEIEAVASRPRIASDAS
jgi:2-iminobutanoate/2-iminopropanoate deaminase